MVITAVFGLVGVVVGGLLTAGVDALKQRDDERRTRRRAARVLLMEVVWDANVLTSAFEDRKPLRTFDPGVLEGLWREHRYSLSGIPFDDWFAIETAVRHATGKAWALAPEVSEDELSETTAEQLQELKKTFQPTIANLDTAARILREYAE
ncbi:MAG TPA: hypothetical protein VN892_08080 [Solirubrobacteraceae bacterium]|nr:hypothetical protein [Solirubrobacteraceae bacterium]